MAKQQREHVVLDMSDTDGDLPEGYVFIAARGFENPEACRRWIKKDGLNATLYQVATLLGPVVKIEVEQIRRTTLVPVNQKKEGE